MATTVKDAEAPAVTVWPAGCVVMDGLITAVPTVMTAALLVVEPARLVATTVSGKRSSFAVARRLDLKAN